MALNGSAEGGQQIEKRSSIPLPCYLRNENGRLLRIARAEWNSYGASQHIHRSMVTPSYRLCVGAEFFSSIWPQSCGLTTGQVSQHSFKFIPFPTSNACKSFWPAKSRQVTRCSSI